MKTVRIIVITGCLMLLASVLATAAVAQYRGSGRSGLGRCWIDTLRNTDLRSLTRGLQLTQSQKEDIKAVLERHRTEIAAAREALVQARLALLNEQPNAPAALGAAHTRIAELRRQILDSIKTILTANQIARLEQQKQKRLDRMEEQLKKLQSRTMN